MPSSEWIQSLTTDGANVFVAYRDTDGIGVLRPGKATVEPFWGATTSHVARLGMGGSDVVTRPVDWSGYAYNAYDDQFTILSASAATETKTANLDGSYYDSTFEADATDVYYGSDSGLWKVPKNGGAGT
jgi:hypothetical protein